MKGENIVDHSTLTKYVKKFHSNNKNLDDLTRSGWPKTMDSKAMIQAIEANPVSSTWRVSSEFSISQTSVVHYFYVFNQASLRQKETLI